LFIRPRWSFDEAGLLKGKTQPFQFYSSIPVLTVLFILEAIHPLAVTGRDVIIVEFITLFST
jgi:hypothetical protein